MNSARNNMARFVAALGLTAILAGTVLQAPANAQNWHTRRDRAEVRYDATAIRRDQAHLAELQRQRRILASHHDWAGVRRIDSAITDTRWRISNKRFDLHHDFDHFYSDRDRDWFYHH